jgi:hypothetical protein
MHYDKLKDTNIDATTDHWVGDPCYVVPDECWDALCNNWIAYDNKHQDDEDHKHHYVAQVADEFTGICFCLWSTAYGDGTYPLFVNDNKVADLGVDAGTLSVIPMTLIEHWNRTGEIGNYQDMGTVVKAEHLRGELCCEQGDFSWGGVSLPTRHNEDEDDEEEEDEWSGEQDEYNRCE